LNPAPSCSIWPPKPGQFLPKTDRQKFEVLQWLMFQMGGVGPMIGQTHHFRQYAPEKIEYAINRYTNETKRLYGVMDKQLAGSKFIACEEYTIADIAIFPWLRNWQNHGIDWADYPHLKKWFDLISERPAVQRGVAGAGRLAPAHHRRQGPRDPVRRDPVPKALTFQAAICKVQETGANSGYNI
jgi:glutathione S-transferase